MAVRQLSPSTHVDRMDIVIASLQATSAELMAAGQQKWFAFLKIVCILTNMANITQTFHIVCLSNKIGS